MTVILNLVIKMLDYKSIGRRIAYHRKQMGITQSLLSEKMNISESYVSQIECGVAKVSLSRLDKIADILGVDIACLLSDRMILPHNNVHPEIFEITKDWDRNSIALLIDILLCVDKKIQNDANK